MIQFHRFRCTDGCLRVLNRFNLWNEGCPVVAFGGTQQKVFRLTALGFIDHDISLKDGDGIKEVTFKRRAQNLCQLPNHTRFAGRLVLIDSRSPGFKSFALFVGQDSFQRFPFAEENQFVIEVCCNTLQFSICPVIESQIQLGHSGLISRSFLHCSDDFLCSSSLKTSAQVRNTGDQSRHPVSSPLKLCG